MDNNRHTKIGLRWTPVGPRKGERPKYTWSRTIETGIYRKNGKDLGYGRENGKKRWSMEDSCECLMHRPAQRVLSRQVTLRKL